MKRLVFLTLMLAGGSAVADGAAIRDVGQLYNRSCMACHASGAAGAPRTGDAAAWAPRLAKGLDTMVNSAKNGFNAMPPRGMCTDCSDAEFKALIAFMAKGS